MRFLIYITCFTQSAYDDIVIGYSFVFVLIPKNLTNQKKQQKNDQSCVFNYFLFDFLRDHTNHTQQQWQKRNDVIK